MADETKRRRAGEAAAEEPTFGVAIDEIETILARLEREEIDIDDLAGEVKRAVELIALCRRKLAATELEVRTYVDSLQQGEAAAPAPAEPDEDAGDRLPF